MTNNTTANETSNTTSNATSNATSTGNETDLLGGLIDQLTAAPELLAVAAVVAGAGAYAYFRVPRFSFLVNKYVPFLLARYQSEIDSLMEKNLTKLQKTAYKKMDSTLQQQIRDSVLRDVIMSNCLTLGHTSVMIAGKRCLIIAHTPRRL